MTNDDSPLTFTVVSIPASPHDRWRLGDPYIEQVWLEILGPTAVLTARRLGRMIDTHPDGTTQRLDELAASLGVPPSVALRALRRLHRFDVVQSDLDRRIIGVSGFAPPVRGDLVRYLSTEGQSLHERLTAAGIVESRSSGRASAVLVPPRPASSAQRAPTTALL